MDGDTVPPTSENASAYQKLRQILKIWHVCMTNVRLRDRSIKVLQYGSQFLMGYYGARLGSMACSIAALRDQSSTARKAFWLLKSINCIHSTVEMVEDGYIGNDSTLIQNIDFLESLFLIWYYWTESQVYFARAQNMFGLHEDVIDTNVNISWFGGDVCYFVSCLLKLREHITQKAELLKKIKLAVATEAQSITNTVNNSPKKKNAKDVIDTSLISINNENEKQIKAMRKEYKDMSEETVRYQMAFLISVLELIVSADYIDFFKFITGGYALGDATVGAVGVTSSALILYEGIVDAIK